jgi:hypothetical protein
MRRILIVPVIAGILLTMSACGAKEETTSTSPTTPATAKSSDSDSSTTEKKTSTTEDDTSDTTEDDGGSGSGTGSGDLPDGLDNDCIAISTLYVTVMAQSTSLMVPGAVSADELEELDKQLEEARSKAEIPDEIAEDFEVWSAAWAEFGEAMSDIGDGGIMDPANAAKFEAASKIIEDPEVEAAGKKIEEFVTVNCAAGGLVEKP